MDTRNGSEIAIVGMNCRFPGASGIDAYWKALKEGRESITFFSDEELVESGVPASQLGHRNYVKAGSVLEGIDRFDASFFGFTPREAEILDPQHRLFLENCWEALELAGYAPEKFGGRIGVFAGVFTSSYLFNLYTQPGLVESVGELTVRHGNEKDYLATRVSYKMNLKGPSVSVQTSCSTSLVAVHMAVQNLLGGECDMALAGGVSVVVPQKSGYLYQEGGILTPDGHCRPFDAKAKGTIFGSGVGVVVLKRLEDALEDGDTIYAVIKGSAINNDGADKVGFTAPSVNGQAEVIADAMAMAEVDPRSVGMIEAHGTGTPLGDPIEISALTRVYRSATDDRNYCAIGSVKSNMGHLGAASGVAGLIKAALSLYHKQIPPTLHFEEANPNIDFAGSPFFVNTELRDWGQPDGSPRHAGVSSFGMGGTNAHVVLEEAPVPEAAEDQAEAGREPEEDQLLILSAHTDSALDTAILQLGTYFDSHPGTRLRDAAYTLQVGRREFGRRAVLVARTAAEALEILRSPDSRKLWRGRAAGGRKLAFVFPGQGSQYVGMAQELYACEPLFRETLDLCAELLLPELGTDLRTLIYPESGGEEAALKLQMTSITQPALFAVEYSLAKLLISWGLEPEIMLGHSIGEYTAAALAGVFSLEDALRIVAVRGRLMQSMPAGAMLSVPLTEAQLLERIHGSLSLAAVNAPGLAVAAGPAEEIEALRDRLAAEGIEGRLLHTSHAFHSAMMDPVLEAFADEVALAQRRPPSKPFLSNLTGLPILPEEAVDPQYWARHLRGTVRFSDGVQTLLADPDLLIVEVGPGQVLTGLVWQHEQEGGSPVAVPLTRHPKDRQGDRAVLLQAVGRLWIEGAASDWEALHRGARAQRIPLPTYPFERSSYWIDRHAAGLPQAAAAQPSAEVPAEGRIFAGVWKRTPNVPVPAADAAGGSWLLLGSPQGTLMRLIGDALRKRGVTLFSTDGTEPAQVLQRYTADTGGLPARIVFAAEGTAPDVARLEALGEALRSQPPAGIPRVSVVTAGAVNASGAEIPAADRAAVLAAARDWAERLPEAEFRRLDVQAPTEDAAAARMASRWADELLAEGLPEAEAAYRGLHRYVPALEEVRTEGMDAVADPAADGGAIVFTGAPDALKLQLAERLADRGYRQFVFLVPADYPLEESALPGIGNGPEAAAAAETPEPAPAAEAGDSADAAARLAARGAALALEPTASGSPEALAEAVRRAASRFGPAAGLVIGPASAEEAYSGLLSLLPFLEAYAPSFTLCVSERPAVISAQEESPRRAEAQLGALAEGLHLRSGLAVTAVRLDRREWEAAEQAAALAGLLGSPPAQAAAAARRELAEDRMPGLAAASALQASAEAGDTAAAPEQGSAPSSPVPRSVEEEVTAIWEELFGIHPIGPDDDFFGLGGNSLLAIQLFSRLRSHYNIELQLENMFDEPTIAGLVKQVNEALAAAPAENGNPQLHAEAQAVQPPVQEQTQGAPASPPEQPSPAGQEEDQDEVERLLRELEGHSLEEIEKELNNLQG
ncbi:beta-ketoacyl synthase N-terminal-like domain-containing protein [Paenibacillus mucilaginosus]|uniref:type I polyketide synthase n=1 Tax=Paenibacillus mucilaginosus TaxID=61624 RepID=UPI001EF05578|nr:type I polyketide synthase [Paenibacillus mucilaginosus]MCG7216939.1 acyltransferase domain-containing protein [Paenibacillus mucilaginosus]WDM25222.1 acyltransferase domain-containing protein [Paenibacillus mucilaginosus]